MQEGKRLIGGQMLLDGFDVSEVVDTLQVVPPAVYPWKKRLETDGLAGLHRQGKSGRTSQRTDMEKSRLADILQKGAVAYGFPNEQWTSQRVRLVIFERFHVEYNSNSVCEILRSLNLSPQKPQVHSVKRDQARITHGTRYIWPRIKKSVP